MADTRLQTARPRCSPVSHCESARTTGPGSFAPAAFSLVELLIVLAIIATASAVAVPRMMESEARWRVLGAARRVAADIAEARSYAIASSAGVVVEFKDNGYTVESVRDGVIREVSIGSRPYDAALIAVDFDGQPSVTFDGFGAGSADGLVTIASNGIKCSVSIAVNGSVKCSDLEQTTVAEGKGGIGAGGGK